ncbi:hypothetical protein [Myroides marinus]|uniref:TolB-like 6-blade propeller-like n=1 Tax=Myroides marinus TaxID=703342 RepID=A0A1H6SW41_9FLAO|nr:hypothetical protein [Myroides marinus]MDM1379485.1 hypothetical protein [Myroides marinus]MDM1386756.1 hypothetical protein [Myroides marinus]MDM1393969.1 hypothetical protein [Myroides marinus]SEI70004.1 hypothetical protein SAMN04488018_103131 [Myroides marinus]
MIINRAAKRGLFEFNKDHNVEGLMVYDFKEDKCIRLDRYKDWRINALSSDGQYVAINKISETTKAYKTDFAIVKVDTQEEIFMTNKYCVYDAAFSLESDKVLLVVHNKKPFCLDLKTKEITAEMPKNIRTYQGSFNKITNQFIAPSETLKDTVYLFDFNSGETTKVKFGLKEKIGGMQYLNDQKRLIVITESSIIYCLDENYKVIWKTDFNTLFDYPVRINASRVLQTEDSKYFMVDASSTETNDWGAEYTLEVETGKLINTVESYQYRGRVQDVYFENKVLLYTYSTLDVVTGEVKELNLNL